MTDVVNHPAHYENMSATITIQPHELLRDFDFYLGNCFKYLFRYRNKGKPLQDLQKAQWYLNHFLYYATKKQYKNYKHILSDRNLIFVAFCDNPNIDFLQIWDYMISPKKNLKTLKLWIEDQIGKHKE
jgi:hypothetical protein